MGSQPIRIQVHFSVGNMPEAMCHVMATNGDEYAIGTGIVVPTQPNLFASMQSKQKLEVRMVGIAA